MQSSPVCGDNNNNNNDGTVSCTAMALRMAESRMRDLSVNACLVHVLENAYPLDKSGPQSGMVALEMAGVCLGIHSPPSSGQIFELAKRMGVTNYGEILSVDWMVQLANSALGCVAIKEEFSQMDRSDVLEHILSNGPILVPYGCDATYEPVLKNARKVHWCVIVGAAVMWRAVGGHLLKEMSAKQDVAKAMNQLYNEDSEFYLVALQGKSDLPRLWNIEDLQDSNNNLLDIPRVGPEENCGLFKWPAKDLSLLCRAAVMLRRC